MRNLTKQVNMKQTKLKSKSMSARSSIESLIEHY